MRILEIFNFLELFANVMISDEKGHLLSLVIRLIKTVLYLQSGVHVVNPAKTSRQTLRLQKLIMKNQNISYFQHVSLTWKGKRESLRKQ